MKLYGYYRSSCSYRVRIALNLKGIEVEHVPVHLVRGGGEQFAPEFVTKNPMAQVPLLELDSGEVLAQSVAIVEYLEETVPTPALLPRDPYQRARVRALVEMVNSGIQPLQNSLVLKELTKRNVDSTDWARLFVRRGLEALEHTAAGTAGRYLVGDALTLADVYLVPQLYNARRFGVDLAPFPTLLRVEAACLSLPAFDRARPERQPDAEP
ncbi:MAG: maleylacetoacetate isomerase [Pseudomonadota bacterium]|nr:MAG: maleylacetoacetate isomerase [Pseudomonadota bacterium]